MPGIRCRLVVLSAAVLSLLYCSKLCAQRVDATVYGRVTDALDRPLAGSPVSVRNVETGVSETAETDSDGRYRFDFLTPGTYIILGSPVGYEAKEREVLLNVGSVVQVDLTLLRLYELEGQVVEAERSRVTDVTTGVSSVVEQDEIDRLPYSRREYQNLAVLAPGVKRGSIKGINVFDLDILSFAGRDGSDVAFYADGVDNSDYSAGIPAVEFPQESIREFRIGAHGFGAEHGGTAGGFINVLTRSGTNEWRGSVYSYLANENLIARDHFARADGTAKPELFAAQFGASIGGPITIDRTHLFAAYEGTRGEDEYLTVNTGGAFPEEDRAYARPVREDLLLLKLDHVFSEGKNLTLRYNLQDSRLERLDTGGSITLSASRWEELEKHMVVGIYDWKNSARISTQLTGSSGWFGRKSFAANPDASVLRFPSAFLGSSPWAPFDHRAWQVGVGGTVSMQRLGGGGRHNVKIGADYTHVSTDFMSGRLETGLFSYTVDNPDAPPLLVSFGLGDSLAELDRSVLSVHAEDEWLATDRLRLVLGARYDLETGILTDYPLAPSVRFFRESYDELQDTLAAAFPELGLSDGYRDLEPDLDNIAPRISASYDLTGSGSVVLRGGYGIYYDSVYDLFVRSMLMQNQARPRLGYIIVQPSVGPGDIPDSVLSYYDPSGKNSNLMYLSPDLEMPYTHQTSVGVTLPLWERASLDVDYVNALGRNELKMRNLNFQTDDGRFLSNDFGNIEVLESIGTSRYDALYLHLRTDVADLAKARVSYTLARTNGSQDGFSTRPQDDLRPLAEVEYGPSRHDATHTLTASVLTDWFRAFEVNSFVLIESPRPYTIFTGQDENGDGLRNDMPEGVSRNSERGDWTFQWDVRFAKSFRTGRYGTTQLLIDVLNITNTSNFGNNYFNTLTSESFGQPSRVFTTPRRVQLGLRHMF